MKKNQRGFTLIELIVVIAIIALLSGIVSTNVTKYIAKAKITRANEDAANILKAINVFYAQYGGYPYMSNGYYDPDSKDIYIWIAPDVIYGSGTGDPYLTVGTTDHHLSELYKLNWTGYDASYFVPNGFYYINFFSVWNCPPPDYNCTTDGIIKCGSVSLYDSNWNWYGRWILNQDSNNCWYNNDYPFRATHY